MRVTHVVLSLDCGGLEQIVLELIRGGPSCNQVVSVICLEKPGTLAGDAESAGAIILCLNKRPGLKFHLARAVAQLLIEQRPDVVHTHQVGALAYAGPAAYWSRVAAVVHTEHGKHHSSRWKTRLLGRFAARFTQQICCVSEDILQEVIQEGIAPASKCKYVPNGIDTGRFVRNADLGHRALLGIPAEALVVGTVGRLTEIKRQSSLIRAFAAAVTQMPAIPFHLLIVGDGAERASLEGLAAELGLRDRVTFTGYQRQPEVFLSLMDIFALTSRSEGMPLAILEAWSAGLPVVATEVGGVPRMIEPGVSGLLVEFDDIPGLAASFVKLALRPDFAQKLGQAGQRVAQEGYDVGVMRARYRGIYHQLLQRKGIAPCAF